MSFSQIFAIGFSIIIFVGQESCTKDTCNDLDTFTTMNASLNVTDEDNVALEVSWTSGKTLPIDYFESIFIFKSFQDKYGVEIENDFDKIETIEIKSPNNLTITLIPSALNQTPTHLDFHFFFPDREDYIDCVHPGSDDEYQLDLAFSIDKSAGTLIIDEFKWVETFFLVLSKSLS